MVSAQEKSNEQVRMEAVCTLTADGVDRTPARRKNPTGVFSSYALPISSPNQVLEQTFPQAVLQHLPRLSDSRQTPKCLSWCYSSVSNSVLQRLDSHVQ
jgi:hypothetical protein